MSINTALLNLLADGKCYTIETLIQKTGCDAGFIQRQIKALCAIPGMNISSLSDKKYALDKPLALLDTQKILSQLDTRYVKQFTQCHLDRVTHSTNALAAQQPLALHQAAAWFTEYQTDGKGRRGRQWIGEFAQDLLFSIAYRFDLPVTQLSGLSIAVGTVVATVLKAYGIDGMGLKWPNDLVFQEKKIAGILLELKVGSCDSTTAIIGVGLNIGISPSSLQALNRPVTSLKALGYMIDRNQLAGRLLNALMQMCTGYKQEGLAAYLPIWADLDIYQGKMVKVLTSEGVFQGVQLGLAEDGALMLQVGGAVKMFHAGEISLRAVGAS